MYNLGKTIFICAANGINDFYKKIIKVIILLGLQTSLWALGAGKLVSAGSLGKMGGLGGIGKTGILGKLGILMLLGRIGLHGIWATGALLVITLLVLAGLFYSVYRYRMRNI